MRANMPTWPYTCQQRDPSAKIWTVPDTPPKDRSGSWPLSAWLGCAALATVGLVGVVFWVVDMYIADAETTTFDTARTTATLVGILGAALLAVIAARRLKSTEAAHEFERERHDTQQARLDAETHRTVVSALRDRYTTAAAQLGHNSPAIRLAGVYAMAALADDWLSRGQRSETQTCIEVLCSILRSPNPPNLNQHETAADLELRQTIVRVISNHLGQEATPFWDGFNFDFTGTVFNGNYSFVGAAFTGGLVSFDDAQFTGGHVSFAGAQFSAGLVTFDRAQFIGSNVTFDDIAFTGGLISFDGALFTGGDISFDRVVVSHCDLSFQAAHLNGSLVTFDQARFMVGPISFGHAQITAGQINFNGAELTGGHINFNGAEFTGGDVSFSDVSFAGGNISFEEGEFTDGRVSFYGAQLTDGDVSFDGAQLAGGQVSFDGAQFAGGTVNFENTAVRSGVLEGPWGKDPPPPTWPPPYNPPQDGTTRPDAP